MKKLFSGVAVSFMSVASALADGEQDATLSLGTSRTGARFFELHVCL